MTQAILPNHILISPTAFKGTLSPSQAASVIAGGIRPLFPNAKITVLPVADGGDGTLDVLMNVFRGRLVSTHVRGPLGTRVQARWGYARIGDPPRKTAVIEMARASGLALVKGRKRILDATSHGTGQLIKAALDRGCRRIFIGVGGTATAEGGAGALQALGLRYYDEFGRPLSARPRDLIRLARVDWKRFDKRMARIEMTVLCDVKNPLLGPRGSAVTFGPQKGASPNEVVFLEKLLSLWSRHAAVQTKNQSGAGAAGALAYGLSAFAGAALAEGAPFIFKVLDWGKRAQKVSWIITGEGKIDRTSFSGKAVGTLLKRRGKAKVAAVCGFTNLGREFLSKRGIGSLVQMGPAGLRRPRRALKQAAQKLGTALKRI